MDRGDDAKKRLATLHQPIPRPTKAAVAQNRAEEESRRESTPLDLALSLVKKGPNVDLAAKVGDPTLVDPTPVAANQDAGATAMRAMGIPSGEHGVSGEIVKGGVPAANEPAPRSDTTADNSQPFARPNTVTAPDPNELKPSDVAGMKPSGPPDPNELTPVAAAQNAIAASQPAPPPVQVNEIQQGQAGLSSSAASASSSLASDKDVSSSKKKKKKGLKKIMPF